MSPKRTSGENGEEVRKRIERWKERVERVQRMRKKMYWKTIGCRARRRKLLWFVLSMAGLEEVCFSIRSHVK